MPHVEIPQAEFKVRVIGTTCNFSLLGFKCGDEKWPGNCYTLFFNFLLGSPTNVSIHFLF